MKFQGFGLSCSIINPEGNKVELGKVVSYQLDTDKEREPVKVEFQLEFQPPPYTIYWTLLAGYPMLTRFMGAN